MRNKIEITCVTAAIFCLLGYAFTAFGAPVAETSLNLSHDARSDTLGPGFVAVADNAGAMNINPAGLNQLQRPEISAFYSPYLLNSKIMSLNLAYPKTLIGALGLGYFGFGVNSIDGRDDQGNSTGGFSAQDRVISLSLAHPVSVVSLGVTAKLIQSQLGDTSVHGYAFDVGAQSRFEALPLSVGFAVRNLGPGVKYLDQTEQLPLSVDLGGAYRLGKMPASLMVGMSRGIAERRTDFSAGLETTMGGMLSLRGSYMMASAGGGTGLTPSLVGGFGLKLSKYQFDASINPMGDLGLVSKFSFTMQFGNKEGVKSIVMKRKAGSEDEMANPDPLLERWSTYRY